MTPPPSPFVKGAPCPWCGSLVWRTGVCPEGCVAADYETHRPKGKAVDTGGVRFEDGAMFIGCDAHGDLGWPSSTDGCTGWTWWQAPNGADEAVENWPLTPDDVDAYGAELTRIAREERARDLASDLMEGDR